MQSLQRGVKRKRQSVPSLPSNCSSTVTALQNARRDGAQTGMNSKGELIIICEGLMALLASFPSNQHHWICCQEFGTMNHTLYNLLAYQNYPATNHNCYERDFTL